MSHTPTVTPLERAEPGIHPVAARMRDVILGNAAEGQPTTEDHLAEFTLAEIKAHFPAARQAADRIVVRQVEDGRGFETRSQLLSRATTCLLRRMPTDLDLRRALSTMGLHSSEIDDLWPELIPTLSDTFARLHGRVH